MRSIYGSRITVLGAGDIGTNFARRAKALGAGRICGVSPQRPEPGPACHDRMLPQEQLDQVLPETEILVMALPSVADTVGILSRERIALLPRDAIVVNVGRGSAIDQDALMEALNAGRIAGAALDVMVPEPLPRSTPCGAPGMRTVPVSTMPGFRSFISSTSVRRMGLGSSSRMSRPGFISSDTCPAGWGRPYRWLPPPVPRHRPLPAPAGRPKRPGLHIC